MIQIDTFEVNGHTLVRTYSDIGYRIKQDETGMVYDEAVDPKDSRRTYTETDEKLDDVELTAEEALDIITGVVQ